MENVLTISYNKGHFTVDLSRFLPSTQKEFKMLLDIVNMSDEKDELAKQLYDFIKSAMSKENAFNYAEYNKVDAYIKKMTALKDILVKTYGITEDEPENKPKTIRSKSSVVYVMEYGKIVCKTGYSFEKGGYTFGVVKTHERPTRYTVYLYGVIVGAYTVLKSKAEAIASIDDRILGLLEKKSDEIEETYHKPYIAAMIEAGYMTSEESNAIIAQVEPEKTAPVVSETVEAIPAINRTIPANVAAIIGRAAAYMTRRNAQKAQWVDSGRLKVAKSRLFATEYMLIPMQFASLRVRNILKSTITAYCLIENIPATETIKPLFLSASYQGRIMVGSGLSPPILKSAIGSELKCC